MQISISSLFQTSLWTLFLCFLFSYSFRCSLHVFILESIHAGKYSEEVKVSHFRSVVGDQPTTSFFFFFFFFFCLFGDVVALIVHMCSWDCFSHRNMFASSARF